METGEQWDRTYRAFHAIVRDKVLGPEAPRAETPFDALQLAYQQGLDDDFVPPTRIGDYEGLRGDFLCDFAASKPVWEWTGEEVALCWNHRPDGLRSLVSMLTRRGLPEDVVVDLLTDRNKPVLAFDEHCLATLTEVDSSFRLPVAFAPEERFESCGDVVARAGFRQLRIAEEPKLSHVTEFFDGGAAPLRAGERRVALALPMDADRFYERPALRTGEIARQICAALAEGTTDFILASFGAAEIVGKERNRGALHEAVRHIDRAVGQIAEAALACGGAMLLCSDHGCCEALADAEGRPSARHTTSPVPCVLVSPAGLGRTLRPGTLVDVTPTVLELLGLPVPSDMTGHSLLAAPK
jgi:2,3-bisphosphoglycerate-independent phosphoglycerate mutase